MEAQLTHILLHTYHPDPSLRKAAEAQLALFLAQPGAFSALLGLAGNRDNHKDLRQAASIVVKNNAREHFGENGSLESSPERDAVKHIVLQALFAETDNSVRDILAETVRNIAEFDFPQRWPNLVPELLGNMQSGDILRLFNALTGLRKVMKRYELKHKEGRDPLNALIDQCFPTIQSLIKTILDNNSIEAAMVLKVCLKIFWSCTMYALPKAKNVDVNFWFQAIAHIMDKALPEASENKEPLGQPLSVEERTVWPWWRLKKWASRITTHFIQRYGNPQYCGEENLQFAEFFKQYAGKALLGPVMNTLALRSNGRFVTDLVYRNCIAYLSAASELSPTYKVIKPHLDFVLFKVIFPSLCLTDSELELFDNDPVEYVRRVHSPLEDWVDVRVAAITLLQNLGRYRYKDAIPKFIPFIQGILNEYSQLEASGAAVDYRRKEGCLVSISSLSNLLMEKAPYKNQLESLILSHIVSGFNNPAGYMRCRVCMFMEEFHEMEWSDPAVPRGILQGLLNCLRDKALPVQTSAACTLRLYLTEESCRSLVVPLLPEIVKEYFRIMSEVENDVILSALQTIVLEFGPEISDLSISIVSELMNAFLHYSALGEEDDEAAFSATQCLDTVSSVLEVVYEKPQIIAEMERILVPLILKLLHEEAVEYIENICDMLGYLTYSNASASPLLWSTLGPLLVALQSWCSDYIVEISPSLMNFISQNPQQFLSGGHEGDSYPVMFFRVVERTIRETNNREVKASASLLTCFVECCHGLVDSTIPHVLQITYSVLEGMKSKSTSIKLLEVAMAIIHYNPALALTLMSANPAAMQHLFTTLFDLLLRMEDSSTQRLIVASFCALLSIPSSSLPLILQTNLQPMFTQILRELTLIKEEDDKAAEGKDDDDFASAGDDEEDEEGEDDDGEEEEEEEAPRGGKGSRRAALAIPEDGYDEDEDCVNAEDEEYLKMLEQIDAGKAKSRIYRDGELVGGEPDSDSDDEDGGWGDDYEGANFTSPVDAMDLYGLFRSTMAAAFLREPQVFAQLEAALEAEDKERFVRFMAPPLPPAAEGSN